MKQSALLLVVAAGMAGCSVLASVVLLIVNANKKADPPADASSDTAAATTTTATGGSGWQKAYMTHYTSYAPCCKNSPNYDPKADKSECTDYSACKYLGQFAGINGTKSLDWVKNNRIAAFFRTGESAGTWKSKWSGKDILVRNNKGTTLKVKIVDTCGDQDCMSNGEGCCTRNANKGGGTLVDLEWYTARDFWKGDPPGTANVEWKLA